MTEDEFSAVISRLTYKPGSTLSYSSGYIFIEVPVIPVGRPFDRDVLTGRYKVNVYSIHNEWGVICAVHEALLRVEMHELNEWLQMDGKQLYNPHSLT